MQIGFTLQTSGPLAPPEIMERLAREGEAMGFDYVTVSDHIVVPRDIAARYPYSDTGEFPARSRGDWQEQLTAVSWLMAKTSRLRFLTSVIVVPHRPAVLTAKILATLDVLSGGRLTIGIGAGWMREEFEALGTPPFAERGVVTDEYLRAFIELWTQENPEFRGKYVSFSNITFAPKPVQKPHPPIWVGGESGPALRRVAKLGDGWYPIGVNPQHPLDTLARFSAGIETLRRHVAEAGREASAVAIGYRVPQIGVGVPVRASDGERRLFSGAPSDALTDLRDLQRLGVSAVDINLVGDDADTSIERMKRFRADIADRL